MCKFFCFLSLIALCSCDPAAKYMVKTDYKEEVTWNRETGGVDKGFRYDWSLKWE